MDFLQYVDMGSFLHRLDPRSKFFFFLSMAVLTSLIKNGLPLAFLLIFFLIIWIMSNTGRYMVIVLIKLRVLLFFVFFLWLILGLFQTNPGPGIYASSFVLLGRPVLISIE